jgi:hypothetical protein
MNLLPDPKDIEEEVRKNPGKFKNKKSKKKEKKKKRYWEKGYVETEWERKERVRKFMSPIYQPIGLGKKK